MHKFKSVKIIVLLSCFYNCFCWFIYNVFGVGIVIGLVIFYYRVFIDTDGLVRLMIAYGMLWYCG